MSKHAPETREEFKELIMRRLGDGVIKINVTEDQVEDVVEEALKYYMDYHFDGNEPVYHIHTFTAEDITNKYITVPELVIGVSTVYSVRDKALGAQGLLAGLSNNLGVTPTFGTFLDNGNDMLLGYYTNQYNYNLLQQILVGQTPIRFNRKRNRVYLDVSWANFTVGSTIVLDGYYRVDPDENPEVWNDRWLILYATAKLKFLWGQILSRYEGIPLMGGVTQNGQVIKDDAFNEIITLEDQMRDKYMMPPLDIIG